MRDVNLNQMISCDMELMGSSGPDETELPRVGSEEYHHLGLRAVLGLASRLDTRNMQDIATQMIFGQLSEDYRLPFVADNKKGAVSPFLLVGSGAEGGSVCVSGLT